MHSLICECKNVFKRLSRYYLIFYEKFTGRLLGQLYLHIIHHSVSILTRTMSTCAACLLDYCNTILIVRVVLCSVVQGMIQKLRNAVVAPTGMGKNYGRIMPLLRQGWLVRQKIMHYGFFGECFSGPETQAAFALQPRGNIPSSQYYFFGRFP